MIVGGNLSISILKLAEKVEFKPNLLLNHIKKEKLWMIQFNYMLIKTNQEYK
jgi:hypothetical protein